MTLKAHIACISVCEADTNLCRLTSPSLERQPRGGNVSVSIRLVQYAYSRIQTPMTASRQAVLPFMMPLCNAVNAYTDSISAHWLICSFTELIMTTMKCLTYIKVFSFQCPRCIMYYTLRRLTCQYQKEKNIIFFQVTPVGFEPNTLALKGPCRKPLDYGAVIAGAGLEPAAFG